MVVRLLVVRLFVAPMKSSTNTSKSVMFGIDVGGGLVLSFTCDAFCSSAGVGSMQCSNLWGSSRAFFVIKFVITSRDVSELEQNVGGDSRHPICMLFGTTI
eukprot:15291141-Ditylum_brightwellii.AAC.1